MNKKELRPFLTNHFLRTLVMAGKVCGWDDDIDHTDIATFTEWCFNCAGKQINYKDLKPYIKEE